MKTHDGPGACEEEDMKQKQYTSNQQVEVFDVGKKRWLKAETLWLCYWDEITGEEAWECELRNGNRGDFDMNHMRKVITKR
jgi:hypothetical protein